MHLVVKYALAAVWLINGLYCKILNQVPRHEEIVGRILGEEHSRVLTIAIGILEIIMAWWIISEYKYKLNAGVQIVVVVTMNIIEVLVVPDLLLWGRWNGFFALILVFVIYIYGFQMKNNQRKT